MRICCRSEMLFLIALLCLSTASGCPDTHRKAASAKSHFENQTLKPGYGLEDLHVGMQVVDLDDAWQKRVDPDDRSIPPNFVNSAAGLEVSQGEGRINSVSAYLDSRDGMRFRGKLPNDIAVDSTIVQVIRQL